LLRCGLPGADGPRFGPAGGRRNRLRQPLRNPASVNCNRGGSWVQFRPILVHMAVKAAQEINDFHG
jgi:hypothetical protein